MCVQLCMFLPLMRRMFYGETQPNLSIATNDDFYINITSCSLTFIRCHPFIPIYESLIVFVIVITSVHNSFRHLW